MNFGKEQHYRHEGREHLKELERLSQEIAGNRDNAGPPYSDIRDREPLAADEGRDLTDQRALEIEAALSLADSLALSRSE
jgi:hypothetical protein